MAFGGVYGGYEVLFVLIIIGSIWNFDGGFPYDSLIAWAVTGGYLLLAGASGFISMWYQPIFHEWYVSAVAQIKAEIEAQKVAANNGNIVVAQNTSGGPVIFDNGKPEVDTTIWE